VRPGGDPERYRLRFQKLGPTALLGHLDLLRELPRVIRRAGVKTHYTQGFHPKPDVSFGPALSLGVASLEEYVDIKLIDAPDADELGERLNLSASEGLVFTGGTKLHEHAPRVNSAIDSAHYLLAFERADLAQAMASQATTLPAQLERFLSLPQYEVVRTVKGRSKGVDIRQWVTALEIDESAAQLLDAARLVGDLVCVRAHVRLTPEGSVRPAELAEFIAPQTPFRAVRARLLAGTSCPLDLRASRLPERPASSAAAAPSPAAE